MGDHKDEILFADDQDVIVGAEKADLAQTVDESWKIMLVDDEQEVHSVTKLALTDFTFEGREVSFISAYSGNEAQQLIQEHPDTALILLDVVMETDNAGLKVAKYIRETIGNDLVRIVLRTGQPGQAPEDTVIIDYDINDYKSKTELTTQKLFTTVVTALRAYNHVTSINTHRREIERIASASARFVPREFLSVLQKSSIVDVRLGDQVQDEMTIMFADVRDFTSLSEQMSPKETFDFINELLREICPPIRQHYGFIDKYLGDGVMALFPREADDALQAAIAMRQQLTEFNQSQQARGYAPIGMGIGLHSGLLMLGTIGELKRMEGTVISDAVNVASRVESLTKRYGATLVISEQTMTRLKDPTRYSFRFVDRVQVKGKQTTVSVFEVFDGGSEEMLRLKLETKADFEQGQTLYQNQNFTEAAVFFDKVLQRNPKDEVARLYLQRAAHFMVHGTPTDWTGVEVVSVA